MYFIRLDVSNSTIIKNNDYANTLIFFLQDVNESKYP